MTAEDETPDWSWTEDADMPTSDEIDRLALQERTRGRRGGDHPLDSEHPLPLSAQQYAVLGLTALGMRPAAIGIALGISYEAAKDSMKQVRRKYAVATDGEAVAAAIKAGRVPDRRHPTLEV